MNHQELFGQDLSDWKLAMAYQLELQHSLMGFFPAILADVPADEELFICLDKDLLIEIAKLLPKRRFQVTKFKVLANENKGIAFDLKVVSRTESRFEKITDTDLPILTSAKFNKIVSEAQNGKCPFKWAPGLISSDMTQEEFEETLKSALKETS